ncbi:hypothetical protein PVAP13_1NG257538 [Panicum virgatum]|uniref:Uncharacterized protein n=1 Tax=Panicum virgatum TaxID=38727 RepID=A0A8T0WNU4_PANVG|nr:hypothetical protein PVAP13_1NG257538 [Panicum virgatum]
MRLPIPTGWPSPEARPLHLPTAPAGTEAQQQQRPGGGRTLTAAGETARHSSARLGSVGSRSSGHRADGEVESRGEGVLSGGLRVATAARLEASDGRSGAALHA